MKFTLISHAGMVVEAKGQRIAIDPWFLGSCYWRSWWNYPPSPVSSLEDIDYVYLTHLHWDHFQGPSLRKINRDAKLLVPESHFTRMIDDGKLFFDEIIEMPHGKTLELADGLEVTSYQFGLMMDSTLAIDDGETTLLDMNDCKLTGRTLDQVTSRHPKVDFVFRSHSSASAYPWCVETDDMSALSYRSNEDYMSEFAATARLVGARYAIPFASAHCFLHRETKRYNDTAVDPDQVKAFFDRHDIPGSECVVMVAGDSWSSDGGFELKEPRDWFSNKAAHMAEYEARVHDKMEAQYAREEKTTVEFRTFKRYFEAQVDAIPSWSRGIFKPKIVFELPERPEVHWVIDYGARTVEECDRRPADWSLCLTIPSFVLKDCLYKKLFSTFSASKRVSIEIAEGRVRDFMIFFQLLDMYEYDYFPLKKMLTARFIRVWARRWREIWTYVSLATAIVFKRGEDPVAKLMPKISTESKPG